MSGSDFGLNGLSYADMGKILEKKDPVELKELDRRARQQRVAEVAIAVLMGFVPFAVWAGLSAVLLAAWIPSWWFLPCSVGAAAGAGAMFRVMREQIEELRKTNVIIREVSKALLCDHGQGPCPCLDKDWAIEVIMGPAYAALRRKVASRMR